MVIKTFDVSNTKTIEAVPLTPEGFSPYGGVISADHQILNVESSAANYGTAQKIHKVAPVVNNYEKCSSGKPATANWNIFRCKAPKHLISSSGIGKTYLSKVLERHPFTTQTFIPMGQDLHKKSFLVIVAKTDETSPDMLPDPSQLRAFVCKGNQSITYGAGTWHAPMVVIDEEVAHIDFAVFIHENGVADEDTQECYFEPGYSVNYSVARDKKL
ncbi:ureidoglycolate hydrolase [Yamadazyma tenuis]|uniref:Ureidoglycolate lyase n=1 Tax=Candida tenuis (strain ATCC 10573 / BCRC 21748 / CBS 615 / JCM 9827 / NBRC 10315 / NRRL Y-1498 / VKM Y-70) TaxID=590646 RepID=G3AZR2_CANTC|nr:ureidoglycolate hydrolase [Yamadazyma tenuis ATCC 10573]EGV65219.1 ureidoglycolate hydrolase [Yamadazyma tenuis ATCC 10573]WEJ95129.1 ureidoglycolate hydrolase [Yamadazyma tenuis]